MKYITYTLGILALAFATQAYAFTSNMAEGQQIYSPHVINGNTELTEGWFAFEGQVGGVTVKDSAGNVLDEAPLTVVGDWMTEGPHEFTAVINFETESELGVLVFKNETIGEKIPELSVELPVRFKPEVVVIEEPIIGEVAMAEEQKAKDEARLEARGFLQVFVDWIVSWFK